MVGHNPDNFIVAQVSSSHKLSVGLLVRSQRALWSQPSAAKGGERGRNRTFNLLIKSQPVLRPQFSRNDAIHQCIIKRRLVSEGGSRCSVHCDRKTERSGRALGRKCWVVSSSGGLAPAPPGFSALVPLPMGGVNPRLKKGCYGIPLRSVEATESALRLLPSRALSSAQFVLIITRPGRRTRPLWWGPGVAHSYLGGKIHVGTNHLPPKEATRHE
jgi:hypothetical protein